MRVVPPNISAATRTSSQVLPARHLQLVNHEPATRDASDQVQECASEEADLNLTTTLNFVFRVTNFFQSFAHTDEHRTSKLRRGCGRRPKALKLHINHETLWAYLFSSTTCSEGDVCGSASMCDGPHAGFPRRATLAAPKGEWPYTEENVQCSCPD